MVTTSNEKVLWDKLDERNKSYNVRVLNYFHYRRNKIGQSWKREEVLTWELIRALDVLPKQYFLSELIKFIKNNKPELSLISEKILKNIEEANIIPYPRLGLSGNKRNCASDIEISTKNTRLYIEAKTAIVKKSELYEQIRFQRNAFKKMNKNSEFGIIALIVKSQEYDNIYLTWEDVKNVLEDGLQKMENDYKNNFHIIEGYKKIFRELIERISSRFEK